MHEINRMLPRHQKIVDLALDGRSNVEIASEIGMTPQAIGMIVKAPIFQDALARRRAEMRKREDEGRTVHVVKARQKLEEASVRAADTLIDQLDHESGPVAQGAAKEILNRTFGRSDEPSQSIIVDRASINVLAIALKESNEMRQVDRSIDNDR